MGGKNHKLHFQQRINIQISNSKNSTIKTKPIQLRNGQKTQIDSSRKRTEMQIIQQTYEKMLSITGHQVNANQNQNKILRNPS